MPKTTPVKPGRQPCGAMADQETGLRNTHMHTQHTTHTRMHARTHARMHERTHARTHARMHTHTGCAVHAGQARLEVVSVSITTTSAHERTHACTQRD